MVQPMNYKQQLIKCNELMGKSGESAFKRATILVSVFEDDDFRQDIGALDDFAAAEVLSQHVQDLCLSFLELRLMLEVFPKIADWKEGKLRNMYDECLRLAEEDKPEKEKRTHTRTTIKDLEEAKAETKHFEARNTFLEKEVTDRATQVQQLQGELQDLRIENATLQGRITELERRMMPAGV